MEFTLDEMMRTGHVKRWQIVRTAREQTIAEHMYRVWAITALIVENLNFPAKLKFTAQSWALVHDVPEVITGDIATPAKEAMRKAVPNDDPIHNIELSLSDTYRQIWQDAKRYSYPGRPSAYEIVKLADIIEAACFLGCEGIGNHATVVREGTIKRAHEHYDMLRMRYPDVQWINISGIVNKSWDGV